MPNEPIEQVINETLEQSAVDSVSPTEESQEMVDATTVIEESDASESVENTEPVEEDSVNNATAQSNLAALKENADFVNNSIDDESSIVGEDSALTIETPAQEIAQEVFTLEGANRLKAEMTQMTMENLIGFRLIDGNGEHIPTRDEHGEISIELLDIDSIKSTSSRSRRDTGNIEVLRESIRKFGQITPILVTKLGREYILVNGMRRLEAIKGLGNSKVIAVVDTTIPPELVKYYDVIVNQSKPYTFTESLAYGKRFKETQPEVGYETIENALGLVAGDFLKALYIEFHYQNGTFPQYFEQVEQGKLTIGQAMKKLDKEIEKAEKDTAGGVDELNSGAMDDQLRNTNELTALNADAGTQTVGERKILDPVLRRSIEQRDEGYCQCCGFGKGEPDFMGVFQVHHIIPVMYGGSDNKGNLILLCNNCHTLVHDYEKARFLPETETYEKHASVKCIIVLGNMLQQLRQEALSELKRNHKEIYRVVDAGKLGLGKAINKAKIDMQGESRYTESPYQTFKDVTADLRFGGRVKGDLGMLNTFVEDEDDAEVEAITESTTVENTTESMTVTQD